MDATLIETGAREAPNENFSRLRCRRDPLDADGPIRVLAIDDNPADIELLRRYLEGVGGFRFDFIHASCGEEAQKQLDTGEFDLIFLDYHLCAESGLDVLRCLRSSGYLGPIITITGRSDQYVVAELMRSGADDYIAKGDMSTDVLDRAIQNAVTHSWCRQTEARNRQLLEELVLAKEVLESKNRHLAEMYELAHRFVADVSHDFRTPLTVIREFAGILSDGIGGELTSEQREYVGYIQERADDLSGMVSDLLDLSHNDAGLLRALRGRHPLASLMDRTAEALANKAKAAGVELTCEYTPDACEVFCDAEKIGRVLLNLAGNAVKFSSPDGRVCIRARIEAQEGMVRFEVSDNGPGIAREECAQIFERFRQIEGEGGVRRKGFGLGLSIARELVRLNLGDIGVDSQVGQGSVFWFSLPLGDPENIARGYLKHRDREEQGKALVSLLVATNDSNVDARIAEEFDEFLQRLLHSRDAVIGLSSTRRMILASTEESQVSRLIDRVETGRCEANRNRPTGPFPPTHIELLRVWRSGQSTQLFLDDVRALCGARIPDMANEVLVVDDDPAIVRALSIRLTALGYRVRTAHDGLMALEAINTARPDVVLLDLRMPQVDGWTVLRLIRSAPQTVSLPVIVVSANAQDAAERQAMDAGATFVIGKPFDWPKLAEAIETVLARSAASMQSEAQPS